MNTSLLITCILLGLQDVTFIASMSINGNANAQGQLLKDKSVPGQKPHVVNEIVQRTVPPFVRQIDQARITPENSEVEQNRFKRKIQT
ncbi:Hypothetical protein CINCED_3A000053 [Cinara cedri]|uniref:Uncharacterized protein n=1 Tax=Cinara cedri TaxID=506608 RepID=A0A5E4NQ23_9HEMI|nr:Hypothetical protein CINCED_3A000053 [Cinara cedri]